MSKVVFFAASLLLVAGIATAGIINPCGAPVIYNGVQPECYFACPQGDTDSFKTSGFWWAFTIKDLLGAPIEDVPGQDFWLIECDPDVLAVMALCGGSASSNADSSTNAAGLTTMSLSSLAVGGCVDYIQVVVQGYILQNPGSVPPCQNYCWNIRVRSCDLNADLLIDLVDLSKFALYYPPKPYNKCGDFDCDNDVDLVDLSKFAKHYGPPGHVCL